MSTVDRCVQEKKRYKFSNNSCSRRDNGSVSKIPFTKQNKTKVLMIKVILMKKMFKSVN